MTVIMNKKHLGISLSKLKPIQTPKEYLEQYTITPSLAADIVHMAYMAGDIEGKIVSDFGCGSGRLAIASSLMGAKKVVGVDIDNDVLETAKSNATSAGVDVEFVCSDIADFKGECDTVIQNPPFGMRGDKRSDRIFLKKSLECGKKIYSLHRGSYENENSSKTREFLTSFIESNGGKVVLVKAFKFDIPYMFKFHRKPKVSYNVDLFVIERVD